MRFVIFVFALIASASMSMADKLPLGAISGYLNDLKRLKADFTQINDDGTISTGALWIKRPGKMRFEYNAPDEGLVLVEANTVAIFDKKSNTKAEVYPLKRTPLSIILARNVDLGRAKMVVGHDFDGVATVVTAQDPERPEIGTLQLKFTANPIQLRQWVVNDSGGGETTVILGEVSLDENMPNRIFSIERAKNER
jgi:outer membrane lipoprotein-sorting protein